MRLSGVIFLFFCSIGMAEEQWRVFTKLESSSYSEPMPINQLINDLEGDPVSSGSAAFSHNQFEIGGGFGSFELSVISRYDYFLEFTSDTVDLVYVDKNDLSVEKNRQYNTRLVVNHIEANGLKFAYKFEPSENFNFGLAASYLTSSDFTDGKITGGIQTTEDAYTGGLFLDYAYTEDKLLDREVSSLDGEGYAIDLYGEWNITENWNFHFLFEDLISEIQWDEAPYTEADFNSNNASLDSGGQIETRPLISGIESYKTHRQQLPLRADITVNYELNEKQMVSFTQRRVNISDFSIISYTHRWSNFLHAMVAYNIDAQAVGVGLQVWDFRFQLSADSVDIEKAHSLDLNLSYAVRF
jgi:hypothetical protein